jgi:hypothetical protein
VEHSEAEHYLRSALASYAKAETIAATSNNIVLDWPAIFNLLQYASLDVERAARADQKIALYDGPTPLTCHLMTGKLLLLEARTEARVGLPEENARKATAVYENYLNGFPADTAVMIELANLYLRLFDRQRAIDTVDRALRSDFTYIPARELRDKLARDLYAGVSPRYDPRNFSSAHASAYPWSVPPPPQLPEPQPQTHIPWSMVAALIVLVLFAAMFLSPRHTTVALQNYSSPTNPIVAPTHPATSHADTRNPNADIQLPGFHVTHTDNPNADNVPPGFQVTHPDNNPNADAKIPGFHITHD